MVVNKIYFIYWLLQLVNASK